MLQIFRYRSRRRFETDRRGGGVNSDHTFSVKTAAVGKSQWAESPYLLANEWIAANIAQFLRLPVPPFALVQKRSPKSRMYISYDYEGDTTPDDVKPQPLYDNFPSAATGIVLFDILIANCDRHGGNLKVDKPNNPSAFYLIDHERALFYIYKGEGEKRLKSRIDRLGVTDGADSSDEWHCLVELLNDINFVQEWYCRVRDIPEWFIREVCNEVRRISIRKSECKAVCDFLKYRRDNLWQLLYSHRDRFPLIPKDAWTPLY
ncbi:MAG: hypothetical protein KF774_16425 [Planctomyces sp.]|nr:hypothetical protein [Planctomyces sp.]